MNRLVQVQFKIDKDLIDRVRGLCKARKEKPEDAINAAMKDWLDRELRIIPTIDEILKD